MKTWKVTSAGSFMMGKGAHFFDEKIRFLLATQLPTVISTFMYRYAVNFCCVRQYVIRYFYQKAAGYKINKLGSKYV
jgi:hypothetical protein